MLSQANNLQRKSDHGEKIVTDWSDSEWLVKKINDLTNLKNNLFLESKYEQAGSGSSIGKTL